MRVVGFAPADVGYCAHIAEPSTSYLEGFLLHIFRSPRGSFAWNNNTLFFQEPELLRPKDFPRAVCGTQETLQNPFCPLFCIQRNDKHQYTDHKSQDALHIWFQRWHDRA